MIGERFPRPVLNLLCIHFSFVSSNLAFTTKLKNASCFIFAIVISEMTRLRNEDDEATGE